MKYFPAFLDLQNKLCVVVGGGRVAERKVQSLLKSGAEVKVISPKITKTLARLQERGKIRHQSRSFRLGDLRGAFLAFAATDDRTTNERVFGQASRHRIPVNVADDPPHCSFIVPSVMERGDLLLAISTSGKSPALAKLLRQRLQKEIGPEYDFFLKLLVDVRRRVMALGFKAKEKQKIFRQIAQAEGLDLIRQKDFQGLEKRWRALLGPGFSLKELGLKK